MDPSLKNERGVLLARRARICHTTAPTNIIKHDFTQASAPFVIMQALRDRGAFVMFPSPQRVRETCLTTMGSERAGVWAFAQIKQDRFVVVAMANSDDDLEARLAASREKLEAKKREQQNSSRKSESNNSSSDETRTIAPRLRERKQLAKREQDDVQQQTSRVDMAMIEGHERVILAFLMKYRDGCERFLNRIPPLIAPTHRLILDAIRHLHNEGERINLLTVSNWLEEDDEKKLIECGGRPRITEIADSTTSEDIAESALECVFENYREKQAVKIGKQLAAGEITSREAGEWLTNLANRYGLPPSPRQQTIQTLLDSGLRKIQLPGDNRLLSAFARELGEELKSRDIFQHGGIAMIVNDERDGLKVITPDLMRTLAEKFVVCYRVVDAAEGKTVEFFKTMSVDNAKGVLSAEQFLSQLPKVDRIATTQLPVMRDNGVIELLPNGYDAQSKTLTLSQCDYANLLPLKKARAVIDELLSEFPFADPGRSKAVAVAAMVGLYAAALIERKTLRPVLIYLANAEGAGKTLLAICAITPTHGEAKIDSIDKKADQTETRKELLAAVIEARPYILFDNVKGHLNSPALEGFTTSTRFSGRVLGVSRMFVGENNMTVLITSNGCTVTPDMRRRSLFVELLMQEEHAEDRVFKRELDQMVLLALRPQVLAALWAFVREWDKAGRPRPSRTHNAFPEWSRVIGGIVEFAGYGCPFQTAEIEGAADTAGGDMHELMQLLAQCEPIKFDELVELSREHGFFSWIIGDGGELKQSEKSRLGKLLKRYDRRLFDQGHFIIDGKGRSRTFSCRPPQKQSKTE